MQWNEVINLINATYVSLDSVAMAGGGGAGAADALSMMLLLSVRVVSLVLPVVVVVVVVVAVVFTKPVTVPSVNCLLFSLEMK